jgi:hypothetical protein
MNDRDQRGATPITTTPLLGQNKNRRRGSGVNKGPTPYAYWEDADKKGPGRALLDEGSGPPVPDEDDPTIMAAMALMAGEDSETYKNPK